MTHIAHRVSFFSTACPFRVISAYVRNIARADPEYDPEIDAKMRRRAKIVESRVGPKLTAGKGKLTKTPSSRQTNRGNFTKMGRKHKRMTAQLENTMRASAMRRVWVK